MKVKLQGVTKGVTKLKGKISKLIVSIKVK